jgi:ABC-2 type transport system permease protein
VFGLAAVAVVLLVAVSFRLSARRDLGGGQLPTRLGPAGAAPSLRSALGLAWRLQRTTLAAWLLAFVVYGGVVGGVAKGIAAQLGTSQVLHDVLARLGGPGALVDAYFGTVMGLLGTLAAGYAIASVLRLRSEEVAGRAEPVLATATSRLRWVASHSVFAFLGPALLLVLGGLATGLAYGAAVGDLPQQSGRLVVAALVQLPAVWLLAGLALALVGVLPHAAVAASWVVLSLCVLITEIGVSLQLSQWTLDLSPFTHVPKLPGAPAAATPLLWLTALAAVLLAVGLRGMRTRDIG